MHHHWWRICLLTWTLALALGASQSNSTQQKKRCIFVHGSGETLTAPADGEDSTKYWGGTANVKSWVGSSCETLIFVHQNMLTRGWTDKELQKGVCQALKWEHGRTSANQTSINQTSINQTSSSDGTDAATVIFTHSMGNLVLAAALADGVCALGEADKWYTISAPWGGSKAADWAAYLCKDPSGFDRVLQWFEKQMGYCNGTEVNAAYLSMQTSDPGLLNGSLRSIASEHASGGLCGLSDFGITSAYSVAMEALSHEVDYGEDNDGMVGMASCVLVGKEYAPDWHSPWYLAQINHPDATLRDGDGDFGSLARQPGQWLAERASGSPSGLVDSTEGWMDYRNPGRLLPLKRDRDAALAAVAAAMAESRGAAGASP